MATAVKKLERSRLSPQSVQREMMGDDLDTKKLLIYLKSKIKFDSMDRVIDITIERTIEGASTVVVRMNDHDRAVLRSGILNNKLDIQIDGLWFRLVKVSKQDDYLDLTFEDREIAILRTYNKLKIAKRSNVTRAEFVVNLLREVKEFTIPYVIPELHKVQPIQATTDANTTDWEALLEKSGGVPADINTKTETNRGAQDQVLARGTAQKQLTVKGVAADSEQIRVANIVIQVGQSMGARRKVIVSAIMTGIVESTLRNLPYGDRDSLGVFQQRDSWGSQEDRLDVATAARLYYIKAIAFDKQDPTAGYGELCQAVQVSAYPDRYDVRRTEAERIVSAAGIPGGDGEVPARSVNNQKDVGATGGDYIYYRGEPDSTKKTWKKEDTWACLQRLADDVHWRAFFISGVFYFIAEDALFKSLPIVTITESSAGVEGIDGDYDNNKKSAEVTVTARVGAWLVPPGAVVVLQDMGPWNGRWLVSRYSRSLLSSSKATIILKKPEPRLPEPALNDINQIAPGWGENANMTGAIVDTTYETQPNTNYVNPLPTKMGDNSEFSLVDAEGAPDKVGVRHHAGKDWFAPGGTLVVAPIAGTLVEVRDSPVETGQVFGGTVKLQQDNGYVWVFRHVHPRAPLKVGARVTQGQGIATVVAWKSGTPHCHIEVWRTLSGGYEYENMVDPVLFIKGEAA